MLGIITTLLLLGVVNGQGSGQVAPGPDQCVYTFTVPVSAVSAQCMTMELESALADVQQDHADLKKENHDLKEKLDRIEQDYREMVNTVKRLKKETASWRAVINWPQIDETFKPDDLSLMMKEDEVYKDCVEVVKKGNKKAGIYKLKPEGGARQFFGFCDEEGWTVIFRRFDGNVSFHRNWNDFSRGFGELSGEFFVGLENLHLLTLDNPSHIHMEAMGWNGKRYTAEHAGFQIGDEMMEYELNIGEMTDGNINDVLRPLNGSKFTTLDRDNDNWFNNNCALYYKGGWWLDNCGSDPSRQWCDGGGCMSWGDVNIKKIILKVRSTKANIKAKGAKGKGKRKRRQ